MAARWVGDTFPGVVDVVLTDAMGRAWHLVDKAPVFGDDRLTAHAKYPFELHVPCDILRTHPDGLTLVALRHGVEAEDQTAQFLVAREQLCDR